MIFGEKNVGNSHHASVVGVVSNSTYPAIQILSYFTATATLLWYLSFRFNLGLEFYVGNCKSSTYVLLIKNEVSLYYSQQMFGTFLENEGILKVGLLKKYM